MSRAEVASTAAPASVGIESSGAELALEDVRISYGRIEIVHGLSLRVAPGQATCLIGANGAGKTTTIQAIVGLHPPTAGSIQLDGRSLLGRPPHAMVRLGIGIVPQGRRVFPSLTVLENLRMGVATDRQRWGQRATLDDVLALFPILGERQRQLAGNLSGGEQQMLAIARALVARPRLLLLDEPSMGLSPRMVEHIYETLVLLRRRGVSMLLAEQNARLALAVSDTAYVLESGTVVEHGPCAVLRDSPRVREIYLGG
jgi:branched-chain amino acid transport system ATP-binding protein